METEPLLTLDDLAQLLGRSKNTIRRAIRRNPQAVPPHLALPHPQLLRWRATDVETWLALRTQQPSSVGGLV
nr:helix-turn-helix domain-containing protein [uncultured Albidiferax sp.]